MTRVVHKRDAHDVYIGRPGPWGNPIKIRTDQGEDNSREYVVTKYREWFLADAQRVLRNRARRELKDKILGCWCAPQACHGDVLAWYVNRPKVLITGSRNWRDVEAIRTAILEADPSVIVHGDAQGADKIAASIAAEVGLDIRRYPAQWSKHGRAAGPIRNRQMLREEHIAEHDDPIDLCLAFPLKDSIGTFDMIDLCLKAGIPVVGDIR